MEMARRMQCRIPAFGEWNYHDTAAHDDDDWSWSVSMRSPVPVHKPIKARARSRRGRVPAFGQWNVNGDVGDGDGVWPVSMNQYLELESKAAITHKHFDKVRGDGNGVATGKQRSRVADSGAHAAARKPFSSTVVGAVDDDLYEVPPDMLCDKLPAKSGSRRLRVRSLLMGCLCLGVSCIA